VTLVNRFTGEPPTEREQALIERRALQIIGSPYSSPQQVMWALEVGPPGIENVYWESSREKAIRKRREERDRETLPGKPGASDQPDDWR
jgi:hypothetical protein